MPWRRAWQPTPVFLPGKSHGQRSLAGCRTWGCNRVGLDSAVKQERWKREAAREIDEKSGNMRRSGWKGAPLRVAWLWGDACLLQWAFAFTAKKQEWFPFFFFFLISLFIYFWLCRVLVVAQGLSLVVVGGGCEHASRCVGSRSTGFSSHGAQA